MKISDLYSAKGLKMRLELNEVPDFLKVGSLLKIEPAQMQYHFLLFCFPMGSNGKVSNSVICKVTPSTERYLFSLIERNQKDELKCLFEIAGKSEDSIEVQAYTFGKIVNFNTALNICVSDKVLEKKNLEQLQKEYVWKDLGNPAIFCVNLKSKKMEKATLRFLSGKGTLYASNTNQRIFVEDAVFSKEKYFVPVDIIIAPSIHFVLKDDAAGFDTKIANDLARMSNPASYFARWEAYDELSQDLIDTERNEFGTLAYSSCEIRQDSYGRWFDFRVQEELDDSFIGRELGYYISDDKQTISNKNTKQIPVGAIRKIEGKKLTTFLGEGEDNSMLPPMDGKLVLFTSGDKLIMARRKRARDYIVQGKTPIINLLSLIEKGPSVGESTTALGYHKPISDVFKRNFSKALDLNEQQIKALDIAINTPDIALIQGPPGTGKTTVIKAICERFRELFEVEEKKKEKENENYISQSPRILITSFQNEAVDNAIASPLPGDLPAFRKTAKRTRKSTVAQYKEALEKWYKGVCDIVSGQISDKDLEEYIQQKNILSDEFFHYRHSGEQLEYAAKLVRHLQSFPEIEYDKEDLEKAKKIERGSFAKEDEELEDPVIKILEAQRIDKEAFSDDGQLNARKLAMHLKNREDLAVDKNTIREIRAVCEKDFTDEAFERYVQIVKKFREQYCRRAQIDINNKKEVNYCLLSMLKTFNAQFLNTYSDNEKKRTIILAEFLRKLGMDYENLAEKYSNTTAATCQTCLDIRLENQQIFDLVIVDEAARANPLDLFIPMSMGKKVILVGDQKQLPHMLEPEILKLLKENPKYSNVEGMEKSLFERLYESFGKGRKERTVFLNQQFRMHPDICSFVSEAFYEGQLKTSPSIDIKQKTSSVLINDGKALTFINISAARGLETRGHSKSRKAEADVICADVKKILDIDKDGKVGIISFYAAQDIKIQKQLEQILNNEELSRVQSGTVDSFQGKEFDYVLLSCVRSNKPKGDGEVHIVGFLDKPNRICVAFSRAIKQLAVYGDGETLAQIPYFSNLMTICKESGCYREY